MERDLRADLEKWAKIRYTPDRLQFADSIIEHAIERALKAEAELNDAWNTADLWKKKYEQAMDGIDDLQHHIDHLNFTIDDQKAKLAKMQALIEEIDMTMFSCDREQPMSRHELNMYKKIKEVMGWNDVTAELEGEK